MQKVGPQRSSKGHIVENIDPIVQWVGPQTKSKVKVDHAEGLPHMFGFGLGPGPIMTI